MINGLGSGPLLLLKQKQKVYSTVGTVGAMLNICEIAEISIEIRKYLLYKNYIVSIKSHLYFLQSTSLHASSLLKQ